MKILLQQLVIGISIGSIYALIASGYALVYSLLDFSNWAHGEVCMLGAYCCWMAVKVAQLPFWLSCALNVGGVFIGTTDLMCMALALIVLAFLLFIIHRTRFGLHVRAVACAGRTAGLLGIRIDRVIAMVFMLAGGLAGLAGILYGMKYNVYPTMGNVGLKAFAASVIGGLGSVPGAIAGAVLLGLIETLASGYISSGLRDLIAFSLLIIILLVRPSGLLGVDVQEKA